MSPTVQSHWSCTLRKLAHKTPAQVTLAHTNTQFVLDQVSVDPSIPNTQALTKHWQEAHCACH